MMHDLSPYLKEIENVIARGPYRDDWHSLSAYEVPRWYRRAKFGIFIHWGVYSVPAFGNEWYSRNMYREGSPEYLHHIETYGKHTEFGYKDFIPLFRAENFDPEEWAELFAAAGADYVVPVAEHHDGFQMYRSEISHWNSYEMGPCRDVLGELKAACSAQGLEVGTSSHRAEHWFFMGDGKNFDSDIKESLQRGDFYWPAMPEGEPYDRFSEPYPTEEFLQDWLVRACEIVDRYQPRLIYFDWWIQHCSFRPYLKKFAAYYYNRAYERGADAVITYKHDSFLFGTAVPDVERGQFAECKPFIWQTDMAVARNSWCYTENNSYRRAEDIVRDLVDIVSKSGRLLLNIGPKADGTIPTADREILVGIGSWLKQNGEAICASNPWRKFGEGPTAVPEGQFTDGVEKGFTPQDIRFTTANGYLYAAVLKPSEDGAYVIPALGQQGAASQDIFSGTIQDVTVLGAASASYQIEGGAREGDRGESVWDTFSHTPGKVRNGDTGDVAADSYHRWREDVELAKGMNLGAYRFSIAWPRIAPDGDANWNSIGFEMYDGLVDALLDAGIQPWVTLYHWDMPQALQNKGGWQNEDTARAFGAYARQVAGHFKGRVKHWFTINEPQCFIGLGYGTGSHAPGLKLRTEDQLLCWKNMLLGHTLAAQTLREIDPANVVGLASCGGVCYPASDRPEDVDATRSAMFDRPEEFRGFSHHHLLDPLCLEDGPGKPDFIGLNIYHGGAVRMGETGPEEVPCPVGGPRTAFDWPVTPEALEWGPRFIWERYHLPVYISENGLSCRDWVALDGQVHDPGRIDFLHRYLLALARAVDVGVDLRGYFQWALIDNFEWAEGYNQRFGLVYVDYATGKRIPKDSAGWYAEVVRSNGMML